MGDAKLLYGYGVWWVSFLLSSHHLLTCRTTTCGGDHRFLWGEIVVTLSVLNHTNTYKYNIPPKKKHASSVLNSTEDHGVVLLSATQRR